jgi:hypothetical protein
MKKLIYLSHPSSGLEENTLDIEKVVRKLYQNDEVFDNLCVVSPVHCYGFMYHDTEYFKGLSFCTDLLLHCDLMLVVGDWEKSTGCKAEIDICNKENIPYIFIDSSDNVDEELKNGLVDKILSSIK